MTVDPYADFPTAASADEPATTRRRWWLAALLSFVAAPAGQIYNGQPRKGILLYVGIFGLFSLAAWFVLFPLPLWVPLLLGLAGVALQIFLVVDAGVQAARVGAGYRLRFYNRWFVFLPLLVALLFVPRLWLRAINHGVVQTFYIPSTVNEPTALRGDHLFVDRSRYRHESPRRGDFVVCQLPGSGRMIVERVVAVGGDRIEIRDKQLFLDGKAVAEPYAVHSDARIYEPWYPSAMSRRDQMPPLTVPAGFVFVAGDNRDNSYDSRFYGPLPLGSVVGGDLRVYWSWDAASRATRWQRTGLFLR